MSGQHLTISRLKLLAARKRERTGAAPSSPKRRAPARNTNCVDLFTSSVRSRTGGLPTWLKSAFFNVRRTPTCGRACFATAKLERGHVLLPLTEPTIAVPSQQESTLYCCMCFVRVPDDELACMNCGGCFCCCCFEQSAGWHRIECGWYTAAQHRCTDAMTQGILNRLALRYCALLMTSTPRKGLHFFRAWSSGRDWIADCCDDPGSLSHKTLAQLHSSAEALAAVCSCGLGVPEDALARQLLQFTLRCKLNSFAFAGGRAIGLFPPAAFFNHSCDANAEVVTCSDTSHPEGVVTGILIRALKPISIGDEITINYLDPNLAVSGSPVPWGFCCACDMCIRKSACVQTQSSGNCLISGAQNIVKTSDAPVATQPGDAVELDSRPR